MAFSMGRQAHYAFLAVFGLLVLGEGNAFATAQDLTFEGSWLFAVGAVIFAIVALWLTCLGAMRSDSADRYRPSSRGDRGGPVYTDIDGHMHVH